MPRHRISYTMSDGTRANACIDAPTLGKAMHKVMTTKKHSAPDVYVEDGIITVPGDTKPGDLIVLTPLDLWHSLKLPPDFQGWVARIALSRSIISKYEDAVDDVVRFGILSIEVERPFHQDVPLRIFEVTRL